MQPLFLVVGFSLTLTLGRFALDKATEERKLADKIAAEKAEEEKIALQKYHVIIFHIRVIRFSFEVLLPLLLCPPSPSFLFCLLPMFSYPFDCVDRDFVILRMLVMVLVFSHMCLIRVFIC